MVQWIMKKEEVLNIWSKRTKALSLPLFENEEEVLIKSGSVILIEEILTYEQNGILLKNIFSKKLKHYF